MKGKKLKSGLRIILDFDSEIDILQAIINDVSIRSISKNSKYCNNVIYEFLKDLDNIITD